MGANVFELFFKFLGSALMWHYTQYWKIIQIAILTTQNILKILIPSKTVLEETAYFNTKRLTEHTILCNEFCQNNSYIRFDKVYEWNLI